MAAHDMPAGGSTPLVPASVHKTPAFVLTDDRLTSICCINELPDDLPPDARKIFLDPIHRPSRITSFDPLLALHSLQEIFFTGCNITSLAGLDKLPNLCRIGVANNAIASLDPLASLTRLTHLGANYNRITSLQPLSGLSCLRELWLSSNSITCLKGLSSLRSLLVLHVQHNLITDLRPLGGADLRVLSLSYNPVESLEPISLCEPATTLEIEHTLVTSLEPVTSLRILKSLHCSNAPIRSFAPLVSLTQLRDLRCSGCGAMNLAFLSELHCLTMLRMSIIGVSSLQPISHLTKIKCLTLRGNMCASVKCVNANVARISSLEPLLGMKALTELNVSDNPLTSLRPLGELRNLSRIAARGVPVATLPVRQLRLLRYLSCYASDNIDDLKGRFCNRAKIVRGGGKKKIP